MPNKRREFEFTWDDFNFLRKISNQHSGILVPDEKFDMFYSRLAKRLRMLELPDFKTYCRYLEENTENEFTEFINAVTTNLTSFFREQHHFDVLKRTIIPEILNKNRSTRKVTAWSAGCSTGEEPYSLAITLMENIPTGWNIKILATDLDTNVLNTASNGIYAEDRVAGLPEQTVKTWFKRGKASLADKVKVKPELQRLIHFKQLNLMQDWPMKNHFDFIFCRNVLIYFDQETKKMLAKKYANHLHSGSCLFIGHSESLQLVTNEFKLMGHTIYRRV